MFSMASDLIYVRDDRTGVADYVKPKLLKHPAYAGHLTVVDEKDCGCPGVDFEEPTSSPELDMPLEQGAESGNPEEAPQEEETKPRSVSRKVPKDEN